ncbi:MAG: choice-of-anchor Q domain-containing protein [Gemmataceae bacterium]
MLTVSNSTLADNSASSDEGAGGGIFNAGTLRVSNSTLADNSAAGVYGGSYDGGGGIDNDSGTLRVSNSTLADNYATNGPGGGIVNQAGGLATLNNTIVSNSTSGGDLYLNPSLGSVYSGSYDLIGDGSYLSSFTNSLQGNPLLAPLGNYGGPTQTMALLPGSAAIDAGSNALAIDANGNALTTDQRGQPRIVGSAVDIGAFESQGFRIFATSAQTQSTDINTSFANALTVTVTATNPLEPVNGGVVTFSAPSTGASATLSASTVVISNGSASVMTTANGSAGSYTVTASVAGASTLASFSLTNAVGPTSRVQPLSNIQSSDTFTVPVTFGDPAGVASVDLYYSSDGGKTWTLYQNMSANGAASGTLNFSFTGQDRNLYYFYSIAHGVSGDIQSPPTSLVEASTDVPDLNPPVTHALTTSSYNSSNGTFTITWAGTDPDQNSGGSIASVAVFVSVDGGAYQPIGAAQSAGSPNGNGVYSGSVTYNALADGQPHTYSFYTLGTDDLGLTQAAPSTPDVTFTNISYTAPLAVTALNVVQSETQTTPLTERSYIRYLEVDFNQSPTVNAPNFLTNLGSTNSDVQLLYFGKTGTVQGSVSLSPSMATLSGNNLFLDFGANGITSALTLTNGQTAPSSPTSNTFGDGWYALGISSSATGTGSPIWKPFFRLLGSATGDTTVTGTATGADYLLVNNARGNTPVNYNADINGDGSVNTADLMLVVKSKNDTAGTEPTSFPQFQLFAGPPGPGQAAPITEAEVQALVPQAIAAWQAAGLNAADVQLMTQAQVQVAALAGNILGLEQGGEIWINDTAAGYGWYVGSNALSSQVFALAGPGGEQLAAAGSAAANEVDLLTVLEHELGHDDGLPDNALPGDLMNTTLGLGIQRAPTTADVAQNAANANAGGSEPVSMNGTAGQGLTPEASPLPLAQTSVGTANNSGNEAGSLAVQDFLFTLLGNLVTAEHNVSSDLSLLTDSALKSLFTL